MTVKKFNANLRTEMAERLAELSRAAEDNPSNADFIAQEITELQSNLGDPELWEHSATEPQGPNEIYGDYSDADGKWIDGDARFYYFQDNVYGVLGAYSIKQDKLLIQEAFDSERQNFERLKRKFAGDNFGDAKASRQLIAEEVRIAAWRREGGACARCGSREKLEYHIVPVSGGGSNTIRNIELLCDVCNRSKSNHIQ